MGTLPAATCVVGVPDVVGVVIAAEVAVDEEAELDVVDKMPPTTLPRRPPLDEVALAGEAEEELAEAAAGVVGVAAVESLEEAAPAAEGKAA